MEKSIKQNILFNENKKKFRDFLKSIGLIHLRTKGSHEAWDRPDYSLNRPVILKANLKNIPKTHIHTNLKTLGIDMKEFKEWLEQS